ncbi:MAG: glycosyltransferase, partial [Candidatus Bathyarchaeia archaeon]
MVYILAERVLLPFVNEIVIAEDSYIENYRGRKNVVAIRNFPVLTHPLTTCSDTSLSQRRSHIFRVVYVGGVTRLRGALELIEALKIMKEDGHQNVTLSLIGPLMPPKLELELNSLVQQHGLEGNVCILGPVPHTEVFSILAQSDVGVAILHPDPNYVESLPTKLFEYMAVGLPVVASNFPLWREIVEGNQCGLCVDPLDPKAIAQAIEYLITH